MRHTPTPAQVLGEGAANNWSEYEPNGRKSNKSTDQYYKARRNILADIQEQESRNIPGRFSRGAEADMIVSAPLRMPAPPHPATALPTMNMAEDVDTPQIREPNSKITSAPMKVF